MHIPARQGKLSARVAHSPLADEVGALQRDVNQLAMRREQRTREQRESQAALQASEARLRRLTESSIVGVFFSEASGAITEANDAFLSMIGHDRADLAAPVLRLGALTRRDDDVVQRALEDLRRTSQVPVLIGGVLLTEAQQQGISLVVDLSELKQAEADRHARFDAEQATRAKSPFLASMSHEIRTPMNAIIGLTHLLLRDSPDLRQRERLGKVDAAAKHLLRLINDILDLSKIEAGQVSLEDTESSVDELLTPGFELVLSRSHDLVPMDVQRPVMGGLAATRAIRQRCGPGLPILAMTANTFSEDRAACLAAGMNDHVAKPVGTDAPHATLLRWLPPRRLPTG